MQPEQRTQVASSQLLLSLLLLWCGTLLLRACRQQGLPPEELWARYSALGSTHPPQDNMPSPDAALLALKSNSSKSCQPIVVMAAAVDAHRRLLHTSNISSFLFLSRIHARHFAELASKDPYAYHVGTSPLSSNHW